jgi:hypothetical protein
MGWKDISKSSYIVNVEKYQDWIPSRKFSIQYQGPKVQYNEGDEISSVLDYRFNIDFTGAPLRENHFPCGYWHKNYIPPITTIFTSLLYPLEVVDGVSGSVSVISGVFKDIARAYTIETESTTSTSFDLISGLFKTLIRTYSYQESLQISTFDLISGQFKETIRDYTIPTESIETDSFDLISGRFRDAIINYDTGLPESVQTLSFTVIGGSHAN